MRKEPHRLKSTHDFVRIKQYIRLTGDKGIRKSPRTQNSSPIRTHTTDIYTHIDTYLYILCTQV